MASVFDDRQICYALEKIGDFVRDSGSGALPEWSDTATKIIIDSLLAFEEKAGKFGVAPNEYDLDDIKYTICELQAFITGDKTDIASRRAANVYRSFLAEKIEELRQRERGFENR
jgi:hypothetical protein